MIIEIPDWCKIGTYIEWSEPLITGFDWVKEKIVAFGYDGFFHQANNCPMYFSKFSDYGETVRLVGETTPRQAHWISVDNGYECSACFRFEHEKKRRCTCGCKMKK